MRSLHLWRQWYGAGTVPCGHHGAASRQSLTDAGGPV